MTTVTPTEQGPDELYLTPAELTSEPPETAPTFDLEPQELREWLGTLEPTAEAGLAQSLGDCVVARCIKALRGVNGFVRRTAIVTYDQLEGIQHYQAPEWVTRYVERLDFQRGVKFRAHVTAATALALMDELGLT